MAATTSMMAATSTLVLGLAVDSAILLPPPVQKSIVFSPEELKEKGTYFYRELGPADIKDIENGDGILSWGARSFTEYGAEQVLLNSSVMDIENMMLDHQNDSKNPESVFVSVTSNKEKAKEFATETGKVALIFTNRAVQNLLNNKDEGEYLISVKIEPSEIVQIIEVTQ